MHFTMPEFAPLLGDEPFALDLQALAEYLDAIPDWRDPRGCRYPLGLLLLLAVLAKLAGYPNPRAIAHWARLRQAELVAFFGLPRATMPHPTTWSRILGHAVAPRDLDAALRGFFRRPSAASAGPLLHLTLDGKTVRGTIAAGSSRGVHLLAVFVPGLGFALAQIPVDGKANEVTAAPRVLTGLPLAGALVSGDAIFTQRALSAQIVAAGGAYLWPVKKNQPQLYEDLVIAFAPLRPDERASDYDYRTATSSSKGHGRQEERTIRVTSMLAGYSRWPGLAQAFAVRTEVREGARTTTTVRYGITSLRPEQAGPEELLRLVREHWEQEAGLHYRRDVTLDEDRRQVRRGTAPEVNAALNNAVVGLAGLHREPNLAAVQRAFAYRLDKALQAHALRC